MPAAHILTSVIFAVISFFMLVSTKDCPADLMRYSSKHTYCKSPNESCKIISYGVSPDDKQLILKLHNIKRSSVATGQSGLPTSSNMMELVWDSELQAVAQAHANQCKFAHDCNECRQVQNFKVGQNMYYEEKFQTGIPSANWEAAVDAWFNEIKLFNGVYMAPFIPNSGYGHFTQMIWGNTWRMGCGYVVIDEGPNAFKILYVCNYGPQGNIMKDSMYETGDVCKSCPANSCCGQSCGQQSYPALCKMIRDEAPYYSNEKSDNIFSCKFHGEDDCNFYVSGENEWKIMTTLSGTYLSIVLKGGQRSRITFANTLKGKGSFCFELYFRTGSNMDGDEVNGKIKEIFLSTDNSELINVNLPSNQNQFMNFKMSISVSIEQVQAAIEFSVPKGGSPQYLEIKDITAKVNIC